jgi:hypothetical protein
MTIPEGEIPLELFEAQGRRFSFDFVRDTIAKRRRLLQRQDRTLPEALFAAWWTPPESPAKDALPISLDKEFFDRPFKDGTYYVRVRAARDVESKTDQYFVCAPSAPRNDDDAASNSLLKTEIALSRANEQLSASLTEQTGRLEQERRDNDKLREDLRDSRDTLAEQDRVIAALQAEIASLKQAGQPMVDHDTAEKMMLEGLGAFNRYMANPGGKPQEMLEGFWQADRAFWLGLQTRPTVAPALAWIARHAPDLLDGHVRAWNDLAAQGGVADRLLTSAEILRQLPAHAEHSTRSPECATQPGRKTSEAAKHSVSVAQARKVARSQRR